MYKPTNIRNMSVIAHGTSLCALISTHTLKTLSQSTTENLPSLIPSSRKPALLTVKRPVNQSIHTQDLTKRNEVLLSNLQPYLHASKLARKNLALSSKIQKVRRISFFTSLVTRILLSTQAMSSWSISLIPPDTSTSRQKSPLPFV
jgi:hypothetical protein